MWYVPQLAGISAIGAAVQKYPSTVTVTQLEHIHTVPSTYGHRLERTRGPVRSPIFKLQTGGLVVAWVTSSESPLLYVFDFFLLQC